MSNAQHEVLSRHSEYIYNSLKAKRQGTGYLTVTKASKMVTGCYLHFPQASHRNLDLHR